MRKRSYLAGRIEADRRAESERVAAEQAEREAEELRVAQEEQESRMAALRLRARAIRLLGNK